MGDFFDNPHYRAPGREHSWLSRLLSADARREHAEWEASLPPYVSNPEIEWTDDVGSLRSWAADWLPGSAPPEDVQEYRRRRRWS